MRGVETRTRLEQLQSLERRAKHEAEVAAARGDVRELTRLRKLQERLAGEVRAEGGTPLWQPPETNQRQRISASRARKYAKAQGWRSALALDDLEFEPRWAPSTTTERTA